MDATKVEVQDLVVCVLDEDITQHQGSVPRLCSEVEEGEPRLQWFHFISFMFQLFHDFVGTQVESFCFCFFFHTVSLWMRIYFVSAKVIPRASHRRLSMEDRPAKRQADGWIMENQPLRG